MPTTQITELPVDPNFAANAATAIAEQVAREELAALAATRGVGSTALQLAATSQVIVTQAGQVVGNAENDLAIIFNPPVENPIFVITNLWNAEGTSSDIGYTDLTSAGVTVKRGYGMTIGGLQDFSWVVLSVPVPTTI
jgi:hypothetical protein